MQHVKEKWFGGLGSFYGTNKLLSPSNTLKQSLLNHTNHLTH